MDEPRATAPRDNVVAGTVGSVLEWYDFAIYGYLAPMIGARFFPAGDATSSLLAAFGVFAIGFAARPVGGAIFGRMGDRLGRKPTMVLSMVLMGVTTFAIGLLPDQAQIGALAPLLLVLLRVAGGLSVGGEFTSSIVFLAEHAPPRRRGYVACFAEFGGLIGFLLGSALAAVASTMLGSERMAAWGWRIPFLLGGAIAVWGFVVRRHVTESPALAAAPARPAISTRAALRAHWRPIVRLVAVLMLQSVGFYLMFVYAAAYLAQRMHDSAARALDINTLSLLVELLVVLPAAIASDRVGRKPMLYIVQVGMLLFAWPLWWLMHRPEPALILAGQAGFAALLGIAYGVTPATMTEMLPARVRCTGVGLGYNLALGLFGGTAPLVATYLVARTADDFAPAWYAMATAAVSLIAVAGMRETAGEPLA